MQACRPDSNGYLTGRACPDQSFCGRLFSMKRSPRPPVDQNNVDPSRRRVLRYGVNALGMLAAGRLLTACQATTQLPPTRLQSVPARLHASDVEGLLLPPGFTARVVARSSQPVVTGSSLLWHAAPDGGAVFPADDGGWIYVSNCELDESLGGAGAIRFAADGSIADAYSILSGTNRNCAGGPTPWNTWLSCEEVRNGMVWECDPYGSVPARPLPALGLFMHEAAAVDPQTMQVYMTEDRRRGGFYRFTPTSVRNGIPDLENGLLEIACMDLQPNGPVTWKEVPDPSGEEIPTRYQVEESATFAGGEGAWYADGIVYFTTKFDNRVWAYDIRGSRIDLIYSEDYFADPVLTGVDNVTVSQRGVVYVAEDGGNMQIVAIDPQQRVFPVVQILGHEKSEVTGPAFDATGTRLYFSSQRGASGKPQDGVTYEVTGPFV